MTVHQRRSGVADQLLEEPPRDSRRTIELGRQEPVRRLIALGLHERSNLEEVQHHSPAGVGQGPGTFATRPAKIDHTADAKLRQRPLDVGIAHQLGRLGTEQDAGPNRSDTALPANVA